MNDNDIFKNCHRRNPDVYLICGKARHGKDTLADYIKEIYEENGKKAIKTSFAKYIKYYAMEMTGWDLKDETKPRGLLQTLGTEVIRQGLNKEKFFTDRIVQDVDVFSFFYDAVIISDGRFEIEVKEIKRNFPNAKIIQVFRPNFDNGLTEEQKKHASETGLDNFNDYDVKIINTTLEELKESARKIYMEKEKEG